MTTVTSPNNLSTAKDMMADAKFFMGYSRFITDEDRYETWTESVTRVMDMHREKYKHLMTPELEDMIQYAQDAYTNSSVLGAQRALQFGGPQIFQHEGRLYNCSASHLDRPEFFQEAMYLLLCGCGVGFSVQKHHVAKLPNFAPRKDDAARLHVIDDSIEGWSNAFGVMISSFIPEGEHAPFPEYQGHHVLFDYSEIRPRGAYISGGFKAPGSDGLRASLTKCEDLLVKATKASNRLKPIQAYDFVMHMADAVLSGGVRRSATLCMFSFDDDEMMKAKTGNWFKDNAQRGRSNNSVTLVRGEVTYEQWISIKASVKEFGEPGFIWTDSAEFCYNPCVEIGMLPKTGDGRSGFQMCNLSEINGGACDTSDKFFDACRAGAILGTLQAGYTNFTYLTQATQDIVEREALIGVSVTGWMNNPDVLFNAENMQVGATIVRATNKQLAAMLGINPAARCTAVKPSGNASVLLGTASGIHGEHSPAYFRNVQMNDTDGTLELIQSTNPEMVETSVWNPNGTDKIVSFPVVSDPASIYKDDLQGVKQLRYVKMVQQNWIEHGTNPELCTDDRIRHNVSNTIDVDDMDEVFDYIWDNRYHFAGISLMASTGDKAYPQAPFTQVRTASEIHELYGPAALFASGLIVDGLHAFTGNLWDACSTAQALGVDLSQHGSHDLLKRDWVRRAVQFADNYFAGDMQKMNDCLKDCHLIHKWETIKRTMIPIDFTRELGKQEYTDISTMGAQACAGGACEVTF
jgi:ribonucleoside-triphosphate reductase